MASPVDRRRAALLALLAGGIAIGCRDEQPPVVITVAARPGGGVALAGLSWEPAGAVLRVERRDAGHVDLVIDPAAKARAIEIRAPSACPERVQLDDARPGDRRRAALAPWIDLGEDRPQIGFDAPFEIDVRPGCGRAVAGRVTWRQIDGPKLADMREEKNGFRLRARTVPFAARRDPPAWGIVPISPKARGAATLEATWRGAGPIVRRVIHVAAAARATGVPSIALGQRVLLGGAGFRVVERPPAGHAEVAAIGAAPSFTPDAKGRWVLQDAAGAALSLRVGRHADTPLDCGRADCHASAAAGAAHTRMTRVLANGLEGALGAGYDASCAIACHAVGEPGLADGGFSEVARELGASLPKVGLRAWSALPRSLRRLGGVGCTACHGPGAIPERASRWTILRTDVCAACHDAPPRYGHVAAWQSTRMARADADPATRAGAACPGCHTTAGFLAAIGVRPAAASAGGPDEPRGIGCAACHAPHAAATERALVRRIEPPEALVEIGNLGPSMVCLRCHAPLAGERAPSASAASLWLGRPSKDEPASPAPHAKVQNGCLGCHAKGAVGVAVERGAGHAFVVDRARCEPCHDCPKEERLGEEGKSIKERAAALWVLLRRRKIVESERETAPHAALQIKAPPGSPEAKAAAKLLTVLEDPAAAAHNAGVARRLLDEAESVLR